MIASKGINSSEYECVQRNYAVLTERLRTNKQAKKELFDEFVSKKWHGPGDCPSENDLVNIALNKIKQDPSEYKVFIAMLEQVSGIRDIVENLKGRLTL